MTVFEKDDRIGGLLRYGIPDFKMEKHLIDRRIAQMEAEGVEFRTGVEVGVDARRSSRCSEDFDAVVLAGGAESRATSPVPGRELAGIHFAMEFLPQQNKRVAGDDEARAAPTRHAHRQGQARRRDRRRRHRLRLRRHLEPPGRRLGHPVRDHAAAARAGEQAADLAGLAAQAAHLVRRTRKAASATSPCDQARRRRGRQGRRRSNACASSG